MPIFPKLSIEKVLMLYYNITNILVGGKMKVFLKLISVFLAALLLLSAVGCGDASKDAFIYFELDRKPSTLDPQLVSTREETVIVRAIFDTLLRYNEDGELVPSACRDYSVDGLSYTFYIKEDAAWTDKTDLTAYDFEFGIKRALDPETKAPAAKALDAVREVKATDAKTLEITLAYSDPDFLHILSTPVTMPCNEEFFEKSKGRYGLELDFTPACGSYYIRKWTDKDKFLIRLAKNLEFEGDFEARNMRVYFTCDERSNLTMLEEADTDFAYLSPDEAKSVEKLSASLSAVEDKTGLLFINPNLDEDIRRSLMLSVKNSEEVYSSLYGTKRADSIAPDILGHKAEAFDKSFPYDIGAAAELYKTTVLKSSELSLDGKKIICYNDPASLAAAKALAAHWQKELGAVINIEESSSLSALESAYKNGDYTLIVMPLTASFRHTRSYLAQLVTEQTDIASAEYDLGAKSLCYPLYTEQSFTAHLSYIENADALSFGGVPDLALAVKKE